MYCIPLNAYSIKFVVMTFSGRLTFVSLRRLLHIRTMTLLVFLLKVINILMNCESFCPQSMFMCYKSSDETPAHQTAAATTPDTKTSQIIPSRVLAYIINIRDTRGRSHSTRRQRSDLSKPVRYSTEYRISRNRYIRCFR